MIRQLSKYFNQKKNPLDFFLSSKMRDVGIEELSKNRIYIFAQIFVAIFALLSALNFYFDASYSLYNNYQIAGNWMPFLAQTIIVLIHRFIPNTTIGSVMAGLNCYISIVLNAYYSGLYAGYLYFLLSLFLLIAILLSKKKMADYFALLSLLTVIVFWFLHVYGFSDFKTRDPIVPINLYFGNLVIFFISGYLIILIHFKSQDKINSKLQKLQNQQVEELNTLVDAKTLEIKMQSKGLEKLRKDIARDFQDEVCNRLAALNILSAIAKIETQSGSSEKLTNTLTKIENTSKEIHQQSRDFLWSIAKTSHKLLDVFGYIRDFADNEFENHGFHFSILQKNIDSTLSLGANNARQIIHIFKEAVLNCIRHSKANNVEFIFEVQGNLIHIYLKDDGIGLDSATLNKVLSNTKSEPSKTSGKGLLGMKHRAESINAALIIQNTEPKGFIISLKVPLC